MKNWGATHSMYHPIRLGGNPPRRYAGTPDAPQSGVHHESGFSMITSRELLAAARAAQGIESNYRLARVLDVPEKNIQRWNTGRNTPDDPMAVRLAEMAGLDPAMVLAAMYVQRTAGGPMSGVWQKIAQRMQAAAAVTAIVSVAGALAPVGDAHARPANTRSISLDTAGLYLMSNRRRTLLRVLRQLLQLLQRLHPPMGAPATAW